MDPLTQATLGAAAARLVARKATARLSAGGAFVPEPERIPERSIKFRPSQRGGRYRDLALLAAGAAGGLAPDLDVLIRSGSDPLLFLEYHRQFTHALAFIPFGGAVVALALWPILGRWLARRELLLATTLGYASHGVLDACTSYGTALLWPFSDARVAWNLVSVFDPLLTLPLLAAVLVAILRNGRLPAVLGIAWVLTYLGAGAWQGQRAEDAARALARERDHVPEQLTVKPSFANLIVWKSIYAAEGQWWVDAVRAGARTRVFAGEHIAVLDPGQDLPWLAADSQQALDLRRFEVFSAGYLAADPGTPGRVLDVRYSMVPNRIDALWGITLAPGAARDQPAKFWTNRAATRAHRSALLALIRGD